MEDYERSGIVVAVFSCLIWNHSDALSPNIYIPSTYKQMCRITLAHASILVRHSACKSTPATWCFNRGPCTIQCCLYYPLQNADVCGHHLHKAATLKVCVLLNVHKRYISSSKGFTGSLDMHCKRLETQAELKKLLKMSLTAQFSITFCKKANKETNPFKNHVLFIHVYHKKPRLSNLCNIRTSHLLHLSCWLTFSSLRFACYHFRSSQLS